MALPRKPRNSYERASGPARDPADDYRRRLEAAKQANTLQLLFKAARLVDEEAVRRVAAVEGAPRLRRSHTALLPHIDLEGTRISELAHRLGISKQAVSELIDDLEAAGVVKRSPDPDDARARRVAFTPEGRQGLLDGLAVLRRFEQELSRAVGAGTMKDLHTALERLLGHLEGER
jgi:DNA-binding MarR family transcriptional regulator